MNKATLRVTILSRLPCTLFILSANLLLATSTLYHIPPASPTSGEAIDIEAVVVGDSEVVEGTLYHRTVGQAGFHESRMTFQGGIWKGTIPAGRVTVSGVEYALVFQLIDGSSLAFPREDPMDSPHRLAVGPPSGLRAVPGARRPQAGAQLTADVLVISPGEGQLISPSDVLIVASFFNVRSLDVNSVRILLDNRDVTPNAAISSDIVTYSPSFLPPGSHTVRIELANNYGHVFSPVVWSFTVGGAGSELVTAIDEFRYSGRLRSAYTLDQVDGQPRSIGETVTRLEGGWQWLTFRTDIRVATDESSYRQPRNRYSITIKSGDNIVLSLGDFTPVLSPYTVDGKRIRGLGVDINLGWLRLQAVDGETDRAVQGLPDVDRSYVVTDIEVDTLGGKPVPVYVLDRRGYTFRREVRSYRFSVNFRNRFQLGFNLLKAKDQIPSIRRDVGKAQFWVPVDTLLDVDQLESGVYTFDEFKTEISGVAKYELSDKNWGGNSPRDNVVLGFDSGLAFDDRRLTFETAWAMSFLNRDIWDGPMTREGLDTLLDDYEDDFVGRTYDDEGEVIDSGFSLEKVIDPSILKDFFIVNQYMTPLVPIDFEAFGKTPIAAVMNMPSAAYKFKMRAFYYGNTFQIQYSQVGPEFKSLANPYLSSNLREFSLSDNVRFFNNKMAVNFDYRHRDNTILKSVVDEYAQNTLSGSFMFTPGLDLPSFSTSFRSVTRTNGKTELDTLMYTTVAGKDSISFQDRRENTSTRTQLLSINVPLQGGSAKYNVLGTFSTVNVVDLMAAIRAEDFSPPTTNSRSFSVVATGRYTTGLRISINVSGYSFQLPASASVAGRGRESKLSDVGANAAYDTWENRLRLQGGLSFSRATGISEFSYYGAKCGVEFRPNRSFIAKMTASVKVRQTPEEVALATLAVKFSANYVF